MPPHSRPRPPAALPAAPPTFVAIEFETADYGRVPTTKGHNYLQKRQGLPTQF